MNTKSILKRITTTAAAAAMALSMAACGGGEFDASRTINVVTRESGSGTRDAFVELMGIEQEDASGNTVDMTTVEAVTANQTSVVITNVSGDPYAIGYISLGSMSDEVKAVNVDGVEATAENVKNGTYTISRPFNIATRADVSPAAQDFINFILSAEGQQVVVDNNYISVDDAAAAFTSSNPEGTVVVSGSSSVTPVMEKLVEAYNAINPNLTIEVQMSDSSSGMQDAIDGISDIGMASRALKDSELAELTSTSIALDGIAVVVSPENIVENLTSDQIRSIYIGETTVWSDVIDE